MTFEKKPQSDPTSQEIREQLEIKNTAGFQDALAHGEITAAANWLETVRHDPKYDARWLDHRSREVFSALCAAGRLDEAERYVDYAQSDEGKIGRRQKIDQLRNN